MKLRTTALVPEKARFPLVDARNRSPSPTSRLSTGVPAGLLPIQSRKRKAVASPRTNKTTALKSTSADKASQKGGVNLTIATNAQTPMRHKRPKVRAHMTTPELSRAALQEFSDSGSDEHNSTTEDEDYDRDVEISRTTGKLPPDYEHDHFAKKYWLKMAERLGNARDSPRRNYSFAKSLPCF